MGLEIEATIVTSILTMLSQNRSQAKPAIFFGNVKPMLKKELLSITGFTEGSLPVRYLGIPLHAKKLSTADCEQLADRLTTRIRSWGIRKMSFATRLVLINSVLTSLFSYWAMIVILPKSVIVDIKKICKNFLWYGNSVGQGLCPVSWKDVCLPKEEGGLGIRDGWNWNRAAIAKLLWSLAEKKDCLWIKWVNHFYMKGKQWFEYESPKGAAWGWKLVCKIMKVFKEGYNLNRWTASEDGKYSIKGGYRWLKQNHPKVSWHRLVWNPWIVPKHAFNLWLLAKDRLKTRSRLHRLGIAQETQCILCAEQ